MTSYGVIHRITVYSGVSNSVQLFRAHSQGGTNPYVQHVSTTGRRINLPEASADPGQIRITFLDKKVAADQSDRWLTRLLGDSEGRSSLRNSRVEHDISDDGGTTYQREYTGRVNAATLSSELTLELVGEDLMVDSLDEIFDGTIPDVDWASPASYIPLGIGTGKTPNQYGPWTRHPKEGGGISGHLNPKGPVVGAYVFYSNITATERSGSTNVFDSLREASRLLRPQENVGSEANAGLVAPDIKIFWTPEGGSEIQLSAAQIPDSPSWTPGDSFTAIREETDTFGEFHLHSIGIASLPGDAAIPSPGAGSFRVVRRAPPTPTTPMHIGVGTSNSGVSWATIVKAFGDSKFGGNGFAYDTARFTALEADTTLTKIRMRVTEGPVSSASWMSDHLWPVVGYAPAVTASGALYPVSWDPPTALPTATLDASNVISAQWEQSRSTQVNQVRLETVKEKRRSTETRFTQDVDYSKHGVYPTGTATDLLEESLDTRVILVRDAGSKRKKYVIKALGVRPPVGLTFEQPVGREMQQRAESVLDMFQDGPQYVSAMVRRGTVSKSAQVGDNLLVAIPWLPDQQTKLRGGTRVMFLVEKAANEDGTYSFKLLDRGPNQFVSLPTLTSVVADASEPRHVLNVTATPPGGTARAEIQIATVGSGVAEPAADSSLWGYSVSISGTGAQTVKITGFPSFRRHWVRAIGKGPGKLPSAFATAVSAYTATVTPPSSLAVTASGTMLTATWTVGDALYPLMPCLVAGNGVAEPAVRGSSFLRTPLPSGAARFQLSEHGLTGDVTVGIKHVDAYGGDSIADTVTVTVGAFKTLLPPREIVILQGRGDVDLGSPLEAEFGSGIEVGWKKDEPYALSVLHHATDSGFTVPTAVSGIKDAGFRVQFPPDNVERYLRVFSQRDGWTTSAASSTVSAKPVPFLQQAAVNDGFAGGFAFLSFDTDFDVILNAGSSDADTDGMYFTLNTSAFDEPITSDTFIARSQFPYSTDQAAILAAGATAYLWVKFWSKVKGFGQEVKATITRESAVEAPTLEITAETELSGTGTFTVKLSDPDAVSNDLYYRTKSGTAAWSAYTLKDATPSDAASYTETVTIVEKAFAEIEFRLRYTISSTQFVLTQKSSKYDKGQIPNMTGGAIVFDEDAGTVSWNGAGDFDTGSAKIDANTGASPSVPDPTLVGTINVGTGRNFTRTAVDAAYAKFPLAVTAGERAVFAVALYSGAAGSGNKSTTNYVFEYDRPKPEPDISPVSFLVFDDGSGNNVTFTGTWTPNAAITNALHDVRITGGLDGGAQQATSTEVNARTVTSEVATWVSGGTGGSRFWWIQADLLNSSGDILKSYRLNHEGNTV